MHKQTQDKVNRTGNTGRLVPARLTLETVTETMRKPGFGPEQLPALWQQITEHSSEPTHEQACAWNDGITVMWQRCETYLQHAELAGTLFEMPNGAWRITEQDLAHIDELLQQATSAQLLQAIEHEQHHPRKRWSISYHILSRADLTQLTGTVIEQLKWDVAMTWMAVSDSLTLEKPGNKQWRHVNDYIRQHLLDGDDNAWDMFHGIISEGDRIGEAAALAAAIEQQKRLPN